MVPGDRSATIRLRAYSESDRASDWGDPARIRFAPVSPDNRPTAADRGFPGQQIVLPILKVALPIFGARRSPRSGAKPRPRAGCQSAANENSGRFFARNFFGDAVDPDLPLEFLPMNDQTRS